MLDRTPLKCLLYQKTILEEDEEEIEEDYEPKIESHTSAKITEVNEESPIDQEKLIESNENCRAESINK